jgi:uncharacterized protein YjiS (DUF1127 family)
MTKMTVVTLRHRADACAGAGLPPVRAQAAVKPVHGVLERMIATLGLWAERHRQRRCLATLDAHLLRDLDIDPIDASCEANKPFWRA